MPLFMVPASLAGLLLCIVEFSLVSLVIFLFERSRFPRLYRKKGPDAEVQRILLWELGTVVALIAVYLLGRYWVVLPLLFLLAFLSMWYLVRVVGRE